jgi:hypothetical protein
MLTNLVEFQPSKSYSDFGVYANNPNLELSYGN